MELKTQKDILKKYFSNTKSARRCMEFQQEERQEAKLSRKEKAHNYDLEEFVRDSVKGLQYHADKLNLTFDVGTNSIVLFDQYEFYRSKKTDRKTLENKADCVVYQLMEMYDAMKKFYGKKENYGR